MNPDLSRRVAHARQFPPLWGMRIREWRRIAGIVEDAESFGDLPQDVQDLVHEAEANAGNLTLQHAFHGTHDQRTHGPTRRPVTGAPRGSKGVVTAAADVADGAMIALVPTAADLDRLDMAGVDGAEPRANLHLTLIFLGSAADWSSEQRAGVVDAVRELAADKPPVVGHAFGANFWNPDATGDQEPSWNLAVGGADLEITEGATWNALANIEVPLPKIPEQHQPWVPHVCLAYSNDPGLATEVASRVGDITFDRLRVAFGSDVTDITLTSTSQGSTQEAARATIRQTARLWAEAT